MKEVLEYFAILVVFTGGMIPLIGILIDQIKESKRLRKH
jgi:hypothetical protein